MYVSIKSVTSYTLQRTGYKSHDVRIYFIDFDKAFDNVLPQGILL